jgi:hypothetical protein
MAQFKTLRFFNTARGQHEKIRQLTFESSQGWRVIGETIEQGGFRGGKAFCLFEICPPLAFFAGRHDSVITVTLQRDLVPEIQAPLVSQALGSAPQIQGSPPAATPPLPLPPIAVSELPVSSTGRAVGVVLVLFVGGTIILGMILAHRQEDKSGQVSAFSPTPGFSPNSFATPVATATVTPGETRASDESQVT